MKRFVLPALLLSLTVSVLAYTVTPIWFPAVVSLDKGLGESVTASTTLQDDDGLVVQLKQGSWHLQYHLFIDGATGGDFKANLAFDQASAIYKLGSNCLTPNALNIEDKIWAGATSSSGADVKCGTVGVNIGVPVTLDAVVTLDTATTVTLQWAQLTSSGTATRILAHADLIATQIQ